MRPAVSPKTWPIYPSLGCRIPPDFPVTAHEAVLQRVNAARQPVVEAAVIQFVSAWKGVAYRYRSFVEHLDTLAASVSRFGVGLSGDERYVQDNALFMTLVAGLSCLECLTFAAYQVGAVVLPAVLPVDAKALRCVNVAKVKKDFEDNWPGETITARIVELTSDCHFDKWSGGRNVLAHRISPGRTLVVGGGGPSRIDIVYADEKVFKLEFSDSGFQRHRDWLYDHVDSLVTNLDSFSKRQIES